MTSKERLAYDEHLSAMMIQNDVLDSAKLEGRIEGRAEGREGKLEGRAEERVKNAQNLKRLGVASPIIAQATGLSEDEINHL